MATLISSYSETNQNTTTNIYGAGNYDSAAQTFIGDGTILDSCKFYLYKGGSPTGNMTALLYAVTGTPGTGATPTGSALATSDTIDVSTLTGSYALTTFTFSGANRVTLTNSTNYFITVFYNNGSGTNKVWVGAGTGSLPGGANAARHIDTDFWYAWGGVAVCFYVYGSAASSGKGNFFTFF